MAKDKRYTKKLLRRYRLQREQERYEVVELTSRTRIHPRWRKYSRQMDRMTKGVTWER